MIQHFISVALAILMAITTTFTGSHKPLAPLPEYTRATTTHGAPNIGTGTSTFQNFIDNLVGSSTPTATITPPRVVVLPKTPTTTPVVPFKPLPLPSPPVVTKPTVPVPTTPPVQPIETKQTSEALLRGAIVNIICIQGGGLRGDSGSGVVIDPRGIIMTVAHVGQSFLLNDYPKKDAGYCTIRTGSPAKNAYKAELIYISREWLGDNDATFLANRPKGTGENDYAFLAIVGSATKNPLPRSFTYIPMERAGETVSEGDRVGTGSYGAEFLTNAEITSSLYPTISFAPVNEVYSFDNNTEDIMSVQAGIAAQAGSSGGAVINADNALVGLITTRTIKSDLSLRNLQAITMDHIRRSFLDDMGTNLDTYLQADSLPSLVSKFESKASVLLEDLAKSIKNNQ